MAENAVVLVVEDDKDLRELIRLAGEKRSYRIITADNGLDAKDLIEKGNRPSLIILDINMPGMDGFSFCRWLRDADPLIPVIFLSARAEEYDKIVALEIGGDDYLTKPFSINELFARAAVSLRRVRLFTQGEGTEETSKPIHLHEITIDPGYWSCEYRGREVLLTVSEFRILHKLLTNPDIVISRDRLALAAFPEDKYNLGRSIDVHICRMRRKLQDINPEFDSIDTVYQLGYKWKS